MKAFMGYDGFGNCPELVAKVDQDKIDAGDIIRASQNVPCPKCGISYGHHPQVQGALWLHRTCEGILVHL